MGHPYKSYSLRSRTFFYLGYSNELASKCHETRKLTIFANQGIVEMESKDSSGK